MDLDLGDVTLSLKLRVKGLTRYRLVLRVDTPRPTVADDRIPRSSPTPWQCPTTTRSVLMDLAADQQVTLSIEYTDEVGNPTSPPVTGSPVAWSVDDPTIINLTDNGDGTATAAATGTLGAANVHVDTDLNGTVLTGDLAINVVAGLAERINIVASEPTEVTPDGTPTPTP